MRPVGRVAAVELLALRTTRVAAGVALAVALITAGVAAVSAATGDAGDLSGPAGRRLLAIGGAVAYPAAFLLGALCLTGERERGILPVTLLGAPHRAQAVLGKALAHLAGGALLGLLGVLVAAAVVLPWAAARGEAVPLEGELIWRIPLGAVLSGALLGAFGVGLGAVAGRRATALSVGLVWLLLVDLVVFSVSDGVGRFLPGGAAAGLLRVAPSDALAFEPGLAVLAGWAALMVALGAVVVTRRRVVA